MDWKRNAKKASKQTQKKLKVTPPFGLAHFHTALSKLTKLPIASHCYVRCSDWVVLVQPSTDQKEKGKKKHKEEVSLTVQGRTWNSIPEVQGVCSPQKETMDRDFEEDWQLIIL